MDKSPSESTICEVYRKLIMVLCLWIGSSTLVLAAAPSQPANLRHQVYSGTAAELFWDRPTTAGLTYEIKRDGAVKLTAFHNPDRTFVSVLDQYFDRNKVMTWMAVNILLKQGDAVRHNFYLYNPAGSKKIYFMPWDYDEALGPWTEPPNHYARV